ncbi:hypothetical protein GQ55_2G227300 [Panicum hallii var. hallii]|uniref:Uncharacterized protein n=1 Tax=Panicum hallii var. hallii TaxID=1504633 RepID=A0A2T7ERD7_9POAL|nr:hypothetical protein GQ55_2G227300 [Panicum hallii var. hallii]PUZ70401.1 hypothetical protein GQ55_2G227300 [Panicum hallii var. hallii]
MLISGTGRSKSSTVFDFLEGDMHSTGRENNQFRFSSGSAHLLSERHPGRIPMIIRSSTITSRMLISARAGRRATEARPDRCWSMPL